MAARLNPRHQEMVREKIKSSQLVNALENHVLKGKKMEPSQVTAALGLLKKCVPDLSHTELTGKDGKDLVPPVVNVNFPVAATQPRVEVTKKTGKHGGR